MRLSVSNLQTTALILLLSWFSSSWAGAEIDCEVAYTTLEINHCAEQSLQAATEQMDSYLAAVIKTLAADTQSIAALEQSQASWRKYMTDYCGVIYSLWRDGSIRVVMALSCRENLTRQRSHQLWQDFLDSDAANAAVLPEPE